MKKIRRNEATLKTQKANLEKEIVHLKSHSDQMNKFMMLGEDKQKEEINKLLDYKVKNIKLESELKELEKEFTKKVDIYNKTWKYSQVRKDKITELEGTLNKEKEIRGMLEDDLNEKISMD